MREKYNNYFRWGVTVITIIAFGILFFFFVFRMDSIVGFFKEICSILAPIILGAVIAYLLNPAVTVTEQYLLSLCKRFHCSAKVSSFIAMACSIALWLGLLIAGISFLFSMIVPEVYSSIVKLAGDLKIYVNTIYDFINKHLQNNPKILGYVETGLDTLINSVYSWVNNDLLIQAQNIMSKLSIGISWVVSLVTNIVVSLIVSIYLLISKKRFLGQAKKLLYVFFKPEIANVALYIFRQTNKIFGGFISGKIIDSLIIGILCFIGVTILKMPYPLLISVFIGLTNIIPFFGPFIGAIPSAFLILLIDPGKCLIFILFIFLLQQLDGNIIGPAILGDSTGVSPFWIVFSILLGGGLFGFTGMLLGVPTFAVIYYLVKNFSEFILKSKELPTDSMLYCKIEKIDLKTGEPVLLQKRPISRRKQKDHNLVESLDAIAKQKKNTFSSLAAKKSEASSPDAPTDDTINTTVNVSDSSKSNK